MTPIRLVLPLLVAALASGCSTFNVLAATEGGSVTASERINGPEKLIDGSLDESTGTAFGADAALDDNCTADFELDANRIVSSFRILGGHDGGAGEGRRAFNRLILQADTDADGTWETEVFDRTVDPDYSEEPDNASDEPSDIDLTVDFSDVTAAKFRLTVFQGFDDSQYDGPRIREVELYAY